jgi:hypothetical protein
MCLKKFYYLRFLSTFRENPPIEFDAYFDISTHTVIFIDVRINFILLKSGLLMPIYVYKITV